MPGENPGQYRYDSDLTIRLPNAVRAKLATARRQERPDMTEEEFAGFVIGEWLVSVGLLPWPEGSAEE